MATFFEQFVNTSGSSARLLYDFYISYPWFIEFLMLSVFLVPIFREGGKRGVLKLGEKTLNFIGFTFAFATTLSFELVNIHFADIAPWVILVFCAITALVAWDIFIDRLCNNRKILSISLALLLFTFSFFPQTPLHLAVYSKSVNV